MKTATIAIDARLIDGTNTGDSVYWTGLLEGFQKLSPNFRFLLFSNKSKPKEIPCTKNYQWIRLNARSSRWWSLVTFPMAAKKHGASVIHTQYNLSPLVRKGGVITIHDVSFFIGPEWFPAKDRVLLQRFVPASAKRADRVITVSETSKQEIHKYIPGLGDKVHAIWNAPSPMIQRIDRQEAQAIVRKEIGVEPPYILTIGTKWPRKNLKLAVAASSLLPASLPHKLVITGKSGWGENNEGDRVIETDYLSWAHVSALYSGADLYVAPSHHEGFGIPVVEAFACGCPVLCSSGGALPEVVGDAAYVEKSWEPQNWAETMTQLLGDSSKLESMRQKGEERAREFSWERAARETLNVYEEVISDRS